MVQPRFGPAAHASVMSQHDSHQLNDSAQLGIVSSRLSLMMQQDSHQLMQSVNECTLSSCLFNDATTQRSAKVSQPCFLLDVWALGCAETAAHGSCD